MKLKIRNIRCWYTKKHTWDEPETKMTDSGVIKRFRCTRWLCDQNMVEQITMEQYLLSTGMPLYKVKQYLAKHLLGRMKENIRLTDGKILSYVNLKKQSKRRIWDRAKRGFTKRGFKQYVIKLKATLRSEHITAQAKQKKKLLKDLNSKVKVKKEITDERKERKFSFSRIKKWFL